MIRETRSSPPRDHRRSPTRSSDRAGTEESRKSTFSGWEPAVHWIAAVLLFVVVGFQPIRGDDFWWQLSRGSVVAGGSFDPSRTLLTMETQADADWLGGLPVYVLFQTFGGYAVMLTRVLVIGACVLWLLAPRRINADERLIDQKDRTGWRLVRPVVWWVVAAAAIALADRFNGTPQMFDCVAIAAMAGLRYWGSWAILSPSSSGPAASKSAARQRIKLAIVAMVFFVVWSNMSQGIFAGFIAWLTWGSISDENRARSQWELFGTHWMLAGGMFLGGMMNPRGAMAWVDSLSALVPSWQNSASILVDTPWQPLTHGWTSPTSLFFLLLSAIWVGYQTRMLRRFPSGVGCFLWFQFLAWSSSPNVALASTWMAADVLLDCRASGRWFVTKPTRSAHVPATILAGPVCVAAALPISNLTTTMGWGIDTSLDNRLLQISLESTRPYGTALAGNTQSGGMLAWEILQRSSETAFNRLASTDRPPLRLQDVPIRSIITGRLDQHRRILDDLREQRLMSYRLTDGSEGGYWVPLEKRQTTLLVVSQTQTELIRGLEPSIWKPLSLDSPVIAYAQAGDAAYVERMIEILTNREIVEYQSWNFDFPSSTGSIFDRDHWGGRLVLASADRTWRQAEVFRAMGLHYAALRVLFVGEQAFPDSSPIQCAIARCQSELADEERIDAGRPSRFRQHAASGFPRDASCDAPDARSDRTTNLASLAWDAPAKDPVAQDKQAQADAETELQIRVQKYLRHGPSALIVLTDFDSRVAPVDSQLMYAGLCGAIEVGNHELAERYLNWFDEHSVDPVLKRLVQIRNEELHPGSARRQDSQP